MRNATVRSYTCAMFQCSVARDSWSLTVAIVFGCGIGLKKGERQLANRRSERTACLSHRAVWQDGRMAGADRQLDEARLRAG